jgi:hypothetical protein
MSAEANLYSALTARAALTALVSTRIFPDVIPEGCALPAIVYQRASTSPVTTIGNVTVAENIRFVITAWAETRTAADAVAVEIGPALAAAENPAVDRSTGYDPECGLYAATVDVDWWHLP